MRKITGPAGLIIDDIARIMTAAAGYHDLTCCDEDGKPGSVWRFFGSTALMFFMRVVFANVTSGPTFGLF